MARRGEPRCRHSARGQAAEPRGHAPSARVPGLTPDTARAAVAGVRDGTWLANARAGDQAGAEAGLLEGALQEAEGRGDDLGRTRGRVRRLQPAAARGGSLTGRRDSGVPARECVSTRLEQVAEREAVGGNLWLDEAGGGEHALEVLAVVAAKVPSAPVGGAHPRLARGDAHDDP